MSVQNPGFEQQGAYAGAADGWRLETTSTACRIHPFGADPAEGVERFDWSEDGSFDGAIRAFFGSYGYEGFGAGWDNDDYWTGWDEVAAAGGAFSGDDVDDFEMSIAPAVWDAGPQEDFESEWAEATTI